MAHICLILEGTYPFITGGVSNRVHMLVSGIPEHDFSIAHIYTGSEPIFLLKISLDKPH